MIDIECAKIRAKMPSFKRKVQVAKEIIKNGLSLCDKTIVSCSFGKDSAVLLHLVMQEKPDIEARFISWDETNLIHNFNDVIAEWKKLNANIKVINLSRLTLDEKVKDRFDKLTQEANGSFVGLRIDESKGRRITLLKDGVIYKNKQGFYRICPLAYFSTEDIAAYIYLHKLPTLQIYKIEGFQERTTSRIPRANFGIRQEMLQRLKQRDLQAFQKLQEIYPEVSEYV
ncbi:phosphoadenosine phosphosulfate reductase family protein [uncultured Gilliamella sp.]|uniref:phosphoadenosine phosphosulfate reductase domain-containing protein n=1 Tax=uncultured Gilliamella sp. TaxID=1193505 RepID=UPI0025F933CE|nr:phosphoadenosine phosphosulfate reductase family protein [uncultured Gilliamella sp.]